MVDLCRGNKLQQVYECLTITDLLTNVKTFMDNQDLLAKIRLFMENTIRTNIPSKQGEPDLFARSYCILYNALSRCTTFDISYGIAFRFTIDWLLTTDHRILPTAYLHLPMPLTLLTNRNYMYEKSWFAWGA